LTVSHCVQIIDCKLHESSDLEKRLIQSRIMRPNVLHGVVTLNDSICHGGHYLASSTMLATMMGTIHTFVGNMYITNTTHDVASMLYRQVLGMFHDGLIRGRFVSGTNFHL
jgi:hypothetical protein